MAILGTKKFWIPSPGASTTQQENQILKNTGYINLQLYSVNYMSIGNFWQNTFGGKDNIVLTTNLKYQSGVNSIEATSIQDVREVKVNHNYNLGLQRNIAVKIPANADALSIDIKITAAKSDLLQAKFDMLNKPEYQAALQLAPVAVGQVLTITSLVKNLFSDTDPHAQLEASYAGIISSLSENNPIANGKLAKGRLVMISTNEGNQFDNVDETKFIIKGDTLYYNNKQVDNTYLIFDISFESLKGDDEKSNWFKKYNDSLSNLDKIQLTSDQTEIAKIYNDSKTMWIEGNALIDVDDTYINSEIIKIKSAAFKSISDKYKGLTQVTSIPSFASATEILQNITGSANFNSISSALPATSKFLNKALKLDLNKPVENFLLAGLKNDEKSLSKFLQADTESYLLDLKNNDIKFKLNA